LVLSYNNESWVGQEELHDMCSDYQDVRLLAFDSKRYVGAQIGIFNPSGEKVGEVSHLRNHEWVVVAGDRKVVERMTEQYPVDNLGVVTNTVSQAPTLFE